MIGKATLKIDPETRDKLRALKRGGETYDAVIKRLITYDAVIKRLIKEGFMDKEEESG